MSVVGYVTRGAAIAFGLLLGAASGAAAQGAPSEAAVQEARRHFEQGEALFASDSFARAEAEFRAAYELMEGHPRRALVLVNVGRAIEEQPGREQEALEVYDRMLAMTEGATEPALEEGRATAQARVAELRARVAARGRAPSRAEAPPTATPEGSQVGSAISPVGPILLGVGGAGG